MGFLFFKKKKKEVKPEPKKAEVEKKVETKAPEKKVEKQEPIKKEPIKKESVKKETLKKEPIKKEEPKKEEPKKEVKKEEKLADEKEEKTRKATYHITKREDGKWQVKGSGLSKATKLFDTQKEAIEYSKTLSKNTDRGVIIHKTDGKIRKKKY